MQDILFNVQSTFPFEFNPNKLMIKVISTDIVSKTAQVSYELIEEGLATQGRISRQWIDKGIVEVPLDIITNAYNQDGTPNITVINGILANFNLTLDI